MLTVVSKEVPIIIIHFCYHQKRKCNLAGLAKEMKLQMKDNLHC